MVDQAKGDIDYRQYTLSLKEWVILLVRYEVLTGIIAVLFYNSFWACLAMAPGIWFYIKLEKQRLKQVRARQLKLDFKEGITTLYSGAATGAALEQAFIRSVKDMGLTMKEGPLIKEFRRICRKTEMGQPLDRALMDFARRSGDEDIQNFAEIISVIKRSGGNAPAMIKSSIETIGSKIETGYEIETMVAAKKGEFRMMTVIPVGILVYLRVCSPGFLDVFYGNLPGAVIMTVILGIYLLTLYWGSQILKIIV